MTISPRYFGMVLVLVASTFPFAASALTRSEQITDLTAKCLQAHGGAVQYVKPCREEALRQVDSMGASADQAQPRNREELLEKVEEQTRACVSREGRAAYDSCRERAFKTFQTWQGQPADFTGQAEKGRNDKDGNVWKGCDRLRAEAARGELVLEKYEVDYCNTGAPRKDE